MTTSPPEKGSIVLHRLRIIQTRILRERTVESGLSAWREGATQPVLVSWGLGDGGPGGSSRELLLSRESA